MEMIINKIIKNIEAMRTLPASLILTHMFAKVLFGIGFGIIIAGVLQCNWKIWGIVFIILSIAVSVPSGRQILRK